MYCMCEMSIVKVLENEIVSQQCGSMLPDLLSWVDQPVKYNNCKYYCYAYINAKYNCENIKNC